MNIKVIFFFLNHLFKPPQPSVHSPRSAFLGQTRLGLSPMFAARHPGLSAQRLEWHSINPHEWMGERQSGWSREGGAWRNFTRLRPPQWRPVLGGRKGGERTWGRGEGAAWGAPPLAGAVGRMQAWEWESALSLGSRSALPGLDLRLAPRSRLPHTGGPGQSAFRNQVAIQRMGPGSPDAPPAARRSVSVASLQPSASARSADSRGAGPPGRGGAAGRRVRVKADRDCSRSRWSLGTDGVWYGSKLSKRRWPLQTASLEVPPLP